jgi:hypothetical protein
MTLQTRGGHEARINQSFDGRRIELTGRGQRWRRLDQVPTSGAAPGARSLSIGVEARRGRWQGAPSRMGGRGVE